MFNIEVFYDEMIDKIKNANILLDINRLNKNK